MNVERIAELVTVVLTWIKSPDSRSEGNYDRADNYRAPLPVLISWADMGLLKGKVFPVDGLIDATGDDGDGATPADQVLNDVDGLQWSTHTRRGLAIMGVTEDHKFATTDPKISALEGIVGETQNLAAMRAQIRAEVLAEMTASTNGDAPATDATDKPATATAPTGKSASKTTK